MIYNHLRSDYRLALNTLRKLDSSVLILQNQDIVFARSEAFGGMGFRSSVARPRP